MVSYSRYGHNLLRFDAAQYCCSAAFEEMESYTNGSHGLLVNLRGDRCESRLDMQSRGPSLFTSGFHILFVVEQVGVRCYTMELVLLELGVHRWKNCSYATSLTKQDEYPEKEGGTGVCV